MTKEPPKGLRANLRSTYSKMDDEKLGRTCKPGDFRKMLFGQPASIVAYIGTECVTDERPSIASMSFFCCKIY